MGSDSLRCAVCQEVVDYFGERLLHVYPRSLYRNDHAAVLSEYSAGYGAAMDDGWGEPKHIEDAVLAERERIVGIVKDYYKVAPKAAEALLKRIEVGS